MSDQQKGKDLRNQLTDLWNNTVEQLDGLKGVIIRQSHVGRKKIDTAVLKRQRDRFLQDLGESIFNQVEAGELEIGPEGTRLIERLREVLDQIANAEHEISRIHQGETPEPSGEFPAIRPDDDVIAAPSVETTPAETSASDVELEAEAISDEAEATSDEAEATSDEAEATSDEAEATSDEAERSSDETDTAPPAQVEAAAVDASASSSDKGAPDEKKKRRAPRKRTAKPKKVKEDS